MFSHYLFTKVGKILTAILSTEDTISITNSWKPIAIRDLQWLNSMSDMKMKAFTKYFLVQKSTIIYSFLFFNDT